MQAPRCLTKNTWTYLDVMEYFGCKKSKAYEIMEEAEESFGGKTAYGSKSITGKRVGYRVYADAVLAIDGTSRAKEIAKYE